MSTKTKINLGYACINMELSEPVKVGRKIIRESISTNRSMVLKTFKQKGLTYASKLALQNCQDLKKILEWNNTKGIKFFRMSSEIFPWASEYYFDDLPDWKEIHATLRDVGDYATKNNHRLTFHPGPFNKLTSNDPKVLKNTIKDLEVHAKILDYMGMSKTPYNKINIHVGAHYNNKKEALKNFCSNFEKLSPSVQTRLTVENDDKASLYSTKELYENVWSNIGIPIVHDLHHHLFCTGGVSNEKALELATKTWGSVKPVVHYSQSRAEEQNDKKIKANAHSDSYWTPVETYGQKVDVMLECKHKEKGLLKMRVLLGETND